MAKKYLKRVFSALLAGSMVLTSIPVPAASVSGQAEAQLKEELRNGVSDEEYPDGMFRFYETQLTANEGEKKSILLCRQGNTDQDATVTFKSIDLSAEYGTDYLLTVKHSAFEKQTLKKNEESELLMAQNAELTSGEHTQNIITERTDEEMQQIADAVSENKVTDVPEADDAKEVDAAALEEALLGQEEERESSLAAAYELQRKEEAPVNDWKETNPAETPEDIDESARIANDESVEYFRSVPGQEVVLHFAPGEYKKEIIFEAIDDDKSESQEQVVFAMFDANGCAVGPDYNGFVNIIDNEEKVDNVFEVAQKEVKVGSDEDTARVVIRRTQGADQMAIVTVGTKAEDAVAGKDYESLVKDIIFAPGQTEKEIEISLCGKRESEKHFWVGISDEGNVVSEDGRATLVTMLAKGEEAETAGQDATDDEGIVAKQSATVIVDDNTASEKEEGKILGKAWNQWSYWNYDFRAKKSITVKITASGSYNDDSCGGKGWCRDKYWEVWIENRNSGQVYLHKSSGVFGSHQFTDTITFTRNESNPTEWDSLGSCQIRVRVTSVNGNCTTPSFDSIEKSWADASVNFRINNDAPDLYYTEKQYTGTNTFTEKKKDMLLGAAYFGKAGTVDKSITIGGSLGLGYTFGDTKNSVGTPVASNTVEFKGYAMQKKGQSTVWTLIPELSKGNFSYDVWKNSKDYIQNGNTIVLAPVFEVKKATIQFLNAYKDRTSFKGFEHGDSITINKLDSLAISSAASSGYTVQNIKFYSLNGNGYKVDNSDSADKFKLTCGFGGGTGDKYCVYQTSDSSKIKVMPDPTKVNTEAAKKGAVLYIDQDKKVYMASLDPEKATSTNFILDKVSLNNTYTLIGVAEEEYAPVWRDGTLDNDETGEDIPLEEGGYHSFTPVRGSALPYTTKLALGRVYYSFEKKQEVGEPQDIKGHVILRDRTILTDKPIEKGINDANVTANGNEPVMTKKGGTTKKNTKDGFFLISDPTFSSTQYYLVNVNAYGEEGDINTSFVMVPGMIGDCVIDTKDDLLIDSAKVYVEKKAGEGEFVEKEIKVNENTGYFSDVSNGKKAVRIDMHADKPGVYINKGELQFYGKDGKRLTGLSVEGTPIGDTNSGNIRFQFVPEEYGLDAGTTIRVTFTDNQGHTYLQRELGMSLCKAYGNLDIANNFAFGSAGTVLKLVGTIDSAFDLGWNGEFDDTDSKYIAVKPNGDRVITVGYSKTLLEKDNKKEPGIETAAKEMISADKEIGKINQEFTELYNNDTMPDDEKSKKLEELNKKLADAEKKKTEKQKKYNDEAEALKEKPEEKKAKVAAKATLSVSFSFEMTFGNDGDFYLKSMVLQVSVDGGVQVNVDFSTPIGVTISLGFKAGGKGTASFFVLERADLKTPKKYYLSSLYGESGGLYNIFSCNMNDPNRKFDSYGSLKLEPYVTISAGLKVTGISAKVEGTAKFKMEFFTNEKENTGTVNLSAGLTIEVLCFEYTWEFANTDISLFGNSGASALGGEEETWLYDSADVLKTQDFDYMKGGMRWKGGSISAKSLDESENGFAYQSIANKVAEHPEFDMVSLGNGKYAAVFLNADVNGTKPRSNVNAMAAYYTLFDGEEWSEPVLIEDDGTLDQDVKIFSLGEKGAIITWSSADREFSEETSKVDMQNALNLHCAFVAADGTVGEVQKITKTTTDAGDYNDETADVFANISYNDETLVLYYQKKEYAASKDTEYLGDVLFPDVTLMSAMTYSFAQKKWKTTYSAQEKETIMAGLTGTDTEKAQKYADYEKGFYGQRFFEFLPSVKLQEKLDGNGYWAEAPVEKALSKEESRKALIIDSDAMSYNDLGVFAYTIDMDGDQKTVDDRDVFMQIYDFKKDAFLHPIIVNSDEVQDGNVQFVRVPAAGGSATYLSWLHGGDIVAMNMSHIVKNYNDLLVNKGTYYYINKTAPTEESAKPVYCPFVTYVNGEQSQKMEEEEQEEAAPEGETEGEEEAKDPTWITEFKAEASGSYVYFVWTQTGMQVMEEEDGKETSELERARTDKQLYTARFDVTKSEMTDPVQVTSELGANYSDITFMVEGEKMIGLGYKVPTRLITMEEYNAKVEENNANAKKNANGEGIEDQEEIPLATEETFVPYCITDPADAVPVSFKIDPKSVVKIKNAEFLNAPVAGENARIGFDLLNDGLDTTEEMTLTVTDANGKSLLLDMTETKNTEDGETESVIEEKNVEQINVEPMLGGKKNRYFASIDIPADASKTEFTVALKDSTGKILKDAEGKELKVTVTKELKADLAPSDVKAEKTEVRNQYKITGTIQNNGSAAADAGKAKIGTEAGGENAEAKYPALAPGESAEFEQLVTLDPDKDFAEVKAEDGEEDGSYTESAVVTVATGENQAEAQITRTADELQMQAVNAIKGITFKGANGDKLEIVTGKTGQLEPVMDSTLANEKDQVTGWEFLQYRFESEDEDIVSVDENGAITANKTGTAKVKLQVYPKDKIFLAQNEYAAVTEGMNGNTSIGSYESEYLSIPQKAIYTKEVTVTVTSSQTPAPTPKPTPVVTPAKETKVGDVVTDQSKKAAYKVTGKDTVAFAGLTESGKAKKVKSITIPATVKASDGKTYKVTEVAKGALSGQKDLKKVTIGKNVTKIQPKAFMGCKKLKTVKIKSRILKKIGKNAFKGIDPKASFRLSGNKKQKNAVKKLLTAKTGFRKATMKAR